QVLPRFSGCVEDAALRGWGDPAFSDPGLFQLLEPGREHVRGDARQVVEQVRVPARASQQLSHDQQGPSLAHEFQGAGQAAVLPVVSTRHTPTVASLSNNYLLFTKMSTCKNEVRYLQCRHDQSDPAGAASHA